MIIRLTTSYYIFNLTIKYWSGAERKKDDEALALIASILETPHIDNTRSLRVLFYKDDQPALFDGYNKRRVCFAISLEYLNLLK